MDDSDLEVSWARYRLPFRQPLKLAHGTLTHREGILIRQPAGIYREAAPLPGFSFETLDDVEACLRERAPRGQWPASLRFALSQDVEASPPCSVRVNALWVPESEGLPAFLQRVRSWPALCVKVKLRPADLELQIQRLNELKRARPGVELRLDPNRSLTVEQTLRVHELLQPEYLEEPLTDVDQYAALWERAPVPIALDESLLQPETRAGLISGPHVQALVLKPTLLGSTEDYSWALKSGKPLVFSSCFESGLGTWALAGLAAAFSRDTPAGLDTNHWWSEDLVRPRPQPVNGVLNASVWSLSEESLRLFD